MLYARGTYFCFSYMLVYLVLSIQNVYILMMKTLESCILIIQSSPEVMFWFKKDSYLKVRGCVHLSVALESSSLEKYIEVH